MTIKQLIAWGIANLIGCGVWNYMHGMDADRASAMFGGGFGMMVTLVVMTWVTAK
jgi:hypothetical protein